jgi:hypothetical protein
MRYTDASVLVSVAQLVDRWIVAPIQVGLRTNRKCSETRTNIDLKTQRALNSRPRNLTVFTAGVPTKSPTLFDALVVEAIRLLGMSASRQLHDNCGISLPLLLTPTS